MQGKANAVGKQSNGEANRPIRMQGKAKTAGKQPNNAAGQTNKSSEGKQTTPPDGKNQTHP
jgi:hypothetical protein